MAIYYVTIDDKFEQVSVIKMFRNRVWDANKVGGPGYVRWDTSSPDTSGTYYPGPGTWGVDATDHTIEAEFFVEV